MVLYRGEKDGTDGIDISISEEYSSPFWSTFFVVRHLRYPHPKSLRNASSIALDKHDMEMPCNSSWNSSVYMTLEVSRRVRFRIVGRTIPDTCCNDYYLKLSVEVKIFINSYCQYSGSYGRGSLFSHCTRTFYLNCLEGQGSLFCSNMCISCVLSSFRARSHIYPVRGNMDLSSNLYLQNLILFAGVTGSEHSQCTLAQCLTHQAVFPVLHFSKRQRCKLPAIFPPLASLIHSKT